MDHNYYFATLIAYQVIILEKSNMNKNIHNIDVNDYSLYKASPFMVLSDSREIVTFLFQNLYIHNIFEMLVYVEI